MTPLSFVPTSLRRLVVGVAPVLLLALGAVGSVLYAEYHRHVDDLRAHEKQISQVAGRLAQDAVAHANGDLLLVARDDDVRDFLGGDLSRLPRIREKWRRFVEIKHRYDQLRLLDASGREVVRVNKAGEGGAVLVRDEELQDKHERYYYFDAVSRRPGEISVSNFDLNVEQGQIERPYKPTIRFALALRNHLGLVLGVVVLNYRATNLLREIKSTLSASAGDYRLVNGAGYVLAAPDEHEEWAFMFKDRANQTLAITEPELWTWLKANDRPTGFFQGSLVSHARLCSARRGCGENYLGSNRSASFQLAFDSPDQPWMIYTRVSPRQLYAAGLVTWDLLPAYIALAVVLAMGVVAARVAWRLGHTVDELTQKDQELRRGSAMIDAFVENSPTLIYMKDLQGRYIFANNAFQRVVLGKKGGSLVGKRDRDLFGEAVASEMQREDEDAIDGAEPREFLRAFATKAGERVFRTLKFPMRDENSKCFAVGAVASEITDRVRAEEARVESEARFRGILDAAPDAIVISDNNGKVALVNHAAEKLYQYAAREVIGMPEIALWAPEVRETAERDLVELKKAAGNEPAHLARQYLGEKKDGADFPAEVTRSVVDMSTGLWTISLVRDVTDRRNLEQQLRQSQKMEAIGQLTGGVAHDFNNLLGIIIGNLDILERAIAGNQSAQKRVDTARKAALRGADLTKRLLAFARRQQLEPVSVRLEDVVGNLVEMASRTLGPEIRISTAFGEGVPAVYADATGLENVLLNLAVNARDAMPGGGMLSIKTALQELDDLHPVVRAGDLKPGRYANLRVSDTGHGIPRDKLERVFEPFFTTKEKGKGTGLGLAMVYGFVKQTGGNVKVYSEVGHGTTVSLLLPLADGVEGARQNFATTSLKEHRAREGATALVVDDESDLLEIATVYLGDMGYRVHQASNGPAALELLAKESNVDLLMTDVIMPGGMNGVQLAEKVRAINTGVKIVYTSGFPSQALSERAGTKVDGPLLNKPFIKSEFFAIMQRVMEGVAS